MHIISLSDNESPTLELTFYDRNRFPHNLCAERQLDGTYEVFIDGIGVHEPISEPEELKTVVTEWLRDPVRT